MLTHIVFFRFADPTPETLESTKSILLDMKGKIPQLLDIEVGIDIVRSERSYDLALITRFESLEAMEAYQVHPVHQKVIEHVKAVKGSTVAVDYES